ncbi:MAG: hypothetical protein ACLR8A_06230 [Bacteroides caccae]
MAADRASPGTDYVCRSKCGLHSWLIYCGRKLVPPFGYTYKTLADLQAVYNDAKAAGTAADAAQTQVITLCDQFYARIAKAAAARGKPVGGDFASITITELDDLKSGGGILQTRCGSR